MAPPRFLLVTGATLGGRAYPQWLGDGSFIGDTGPDSSWVAWRLAGANNRELGRSAAVFPDLSTCRQAISEVREGVVDAETLVAIDYLSAQWGWQLTVGGRLVAVSGRLFRRERECRYNLTQFVGAVPGARLPFDTPNHEAPLTGPSLALLPYPPRGPSSEAAEQ